MASQGKDITGGRADPLLPARRAWRSLRHGFESRFLSDAELLSRRYRRHHGRRPDLKNPRGFAEKILWLSLNGMTPLHTRCVDKIRVRDFVRERVGEDHLVPEILIAWDADELTPENIPAERFVIKNNNDSGGVVICRDRAGFDWEAAREAARGRAETDYYRHQRERQYQGIRPGFLVEEYLDPGEGGDLEDFKIYCFNGAPRFVQVHQDRFTRHVADFFDLDWTPVPVARVYPRSARPRPAPPATLPEMLCVAAALAEPFAFVRVDLYEHEGRVRFGELTFTPDAGFVRLDPPEYEQVFGDMLDLPAAAR